MSTINRVPGTWLRTLSIALFTLVTVIPLDAFAAGDVEVSTFKIYVCMGILAAAAVLFLTEAIPLAMTSLMVPVLLIAFNVLDAKEAFAGFSNPQVLLFLMMFIVGDALFRVGIADRIGRAIIHLARDSENLLIVFIMVVGGIMSAFLSNTGTAACLLPIVLAVAKSNKISPRKLLMPLAFGVSLGGMNTLIGTPPNGIVADAFEKATGEQFGILDFAKPSFLVMVVGIVYMVTIGKKLLASGVDRSGAGNSITTGDLPIQKYRRDKAWIVVIAFVSIIFFMVMDPLWERIFPANRAIHEYFKQIPLVTYAMIGVVVIVSTRTLLPKEAYEAVDWTTIFLFAGMLSMSSALQASGAAKYIGETIVAVTGGSPYGALIGIIIVTIVVTNFMSNTATAALFAPISVSISMNLHVNPATLLMGVGLSASACFLTPVATPPNTLVLGPGGYSFMDYVKAGALLQIIVGLILIFTIPLFFPF